MIDSEYNLTLVAVSYVISVFGSYTALNLAIRIPSANTGASLFGWLTMAAIAIGGGAIWSMHFIGMLAFETNIPVSYDATLTVLSMVLAIFVCGIGLFVVGRGTSSALKLLAGGVITGLGVAGMHYTGMAAMEMPATISYDTTLFAASIGIAIVAAIAALWLAFNLRGNLQRFGSAFVMGVAVCGMHYTGMAAMKMEPTGARMFVSNTDNYLLSVYIFLAAGVVLAIMLVTSILLSPKSNELVFGE
ncbi:MAG: hypothetical protein [Olavius algarvensis Gamma 3 endosymbiont]|nr:MAG: hypothetical protein [Olavius algarvensis Gamma 3 endosymbiont]